MHIGALGHLRRQTLRTHARFDFIAVGLIVRGGGTYRVEGRPAAEVSAGSVISVYPGPAFDYAPRDWWGEYYIGFAGKGAHALLDSGFVSTHSAPRRVSNVAARIAAFEEILRVWQRAGPGDADRACVLGRLLLIDLLADAGGDAPSDLVEAVVSHCRQHALSHIDFPSLAERHGMSYSGLRRAIRDRTGLPPAKLVTKLRCDAACVLLATTTLAVKEIAVRVGIDDPYTFSRTFRRTLGRSPERYRRQQRVYRPPAGESPHD